jgi:hypothetical protein
VVDLAETADGMSMANCRQGSRLGRSVVFGGRMSKPCNNYVSR